MSGCKIEIGGACLYIAYKWNRTSCIWAWGVNINVAGLYRGHLVPRHGTRQVCQSTRVYFTEIWDIIVSYHFRELKWFPVDVPSLICLTDEKHQSCEWVIDSLRGYVIRIWAISFFANLKWKGDGWAGQRIGAWETVDVRSVGIWPVHLQERRA